jgi:hypothetical protein
MSNDTGRYRREPSDLVGRILDLERRLSRLERTPRLGTSAINKGSLIVTDADGDPRVQVGLLSDDSYGIEMKETGQDNFHQVPYVFADTVETFEGTTSTSFVDLATVGPSVEVPVRSSGRILVQLFTQVQWPASTPATSKVEGGYASFVGSGANTISLADAVAKLLPMHVWSWAISGGGTFSDTSTMMSASGAVFTGLTPGDTTFTAKYRSAAGNTCEFGRRTIVVTAL